MATFQDTAKTTVIVDGKQGINELGKLEMEASEYRQQLKGMRKDTQQWVNTNNKLKNVKAKIADVRKELGLSGMTMRQLRSYQRELMREMDVTTTRGTKRYKELNAQLLQVNNRIRQQRMEVRGMGSVWQKMGTGVSSSLSMFGPSAAITAGIFAALRGLQDFVKTFVNLQKENSKLAGILRVSTSETKQLKQQQRELGKTTEFTATQVAKAQIELAKLGKTQQEIIDMTPALLAGATSMGVDLASAAELVAGQMNAFQKETKEATQVVDVLAKATQISAFDFERLKTSLAIVGPAAKASNATLEQTVAILSAAIDANVDASSAGTALRNIFIDISDKGLTLQEALEKIRNSQDKLTTANELFGKRGAVVATVIAENIEKIDMQTKSLIMLQVQPRSLQTSSWTTLPVT